MEIDQVEAVGDRVMKRAEDLLGIPLDRWPARAMGVGTAIQMIDGQNRLYEAWGCVIGRIYSFTLCSVDQGLEMDVRGHDVLNATVLETGLFVRT